ncbi:hypothetical protein HMI54_007640 [Coelomomyces lativittatus]|nr:hypothetical protein HMI55_005791 [Coelomomyces lativittatus]KAJ1499614.1 hypothetical protein HMI56_004293 [Coelomomyces lativittatus]KAJ1503897.1 hypothetical protein HMI54_007640 [Coelomomyces lativittatus]
MSYSKVFGNMSTLINNVVPFPYIVDHFLSSFSLYFYLWTQCFSSSFPLGVLKRDISLFLMNFHHFFLPLNSIKIKKKEKGREKNQNNNESNNLYLTKWNEQRKKMTSTYTFFYLDLYVSI